MVSLAKKQKSKQFFLSLLARYDLANILGKAVCLLNYGLNKALNQRPQTAFEG